MRAHSSIQRAFRNTQKTLGFGLLAIGTVLASSACGSSEAADSSNAVAPQTTLTSAPNVIFGEEMSIIDFADQRDLATYPAGVALVEVTSETRIANPTTEQLGVGSIGRSVRLQIVEVVRQNAPEPLPGTVDVNTSGWVLVDGKEMLEGSEDGPRFEVGKSYIAG